MRILIVGMALLVVVAAHLNGLHQARQNRGEPRGGTLTLTEREVPLVFIPGDSTVTLLDLSWDVLGSGPSYNRRPDWLDGGKLAELGFAYSVPLTDPKAEAHYRSLLPREVYLVLEFEGEAWRKAPADRDRTTRLFVVDAGLDPARLRERYPEVSRHAIARGVVRLRYLHPGHREDGGEASEEPRLVGWIQNLVPSQVFVPRPHSDALAQFRKEDRERRRAGAHGREAEPRYSVVLSWGADYTPWVSGMP